MSNEPNKMEWTTYYGNYWERTIIDMKNTKQAKWVNSLGANGTYELDFEYDYPEIKMCVGKEK